jgi:putative restriction endonuclease
MPAWDDDMRIRQAAFAWLTVCTRSDPNGIVSWEQLNAFQVDGERVPLVGMSGIWKPRMLRLPISVTTAPARPGRTALYDDEEGPDGTFLYRYRGTDPEHRDNRGVRALMEQVRPLIYLCGVDRGRYMAFCPAYVTGDDRATLTFTLLLDAMEAGLSQESVVSEDLTPRRRYVTVAARQRLHQAFFRLRVLRAYRSRCTVCRLGHDRLLDAAHILPDRDERGVPSTRNGLSLCKIHHAAFDENILGIDPDYRIHVRQDILDERDGPMLLHGLQEFAGRNLIVMPRREDERPGREFLEARFEGFRRAE